MHSSSERFGVAVQDPQLAGGAHRVAVFDDGRRLSNSLITRVEELLPRHRWSQIKGLAVATGPGGFTGTRLSIVMARTLAQQLNCPLLGVSSYSLMAARLFPGDRPFWLTRLLSRRGIVGGYYQVINETVIEIRAPHLLSQESDITPIIEAEEDVTVDVGRLLCLLHDAYIKGEPMPWQQVLPIYPTSPVGYV